MLKNGEHRMNASSWMLMTGYLVLCTVLSITAFYVLDINTDLPSKENWTIVEVEETKQVCNDE